MSVKGDCGNCWSGREGMHKDVEITKKRSGKTNMLASETKYNDNEYNTGSDPGKKKVPELYLLLSWLAHQQ